MDEEPEFNISIFIFSALNAPCVEGKKRYFILSRQGNTSRREHARVEAGGGMGPVLLHFYREGFFWMSLMNSAAIFGSNCVPALRLISRTASGTDILAL